MSRGETDTAVELRHPGAALVGRDQPLARVRAALDRARSGQVVVLVVQGEAGIGKTALVDALVAGSTALRVSGVETEAQLPLGVVDQLLRVVEGPAHGLLARDGHTEPSVELAAAERVVRLLAAAVHDGPIVLVVDDAHWADAASLRTLLFALRRLARRPLLVVFALRPAEGLELPEGLAKLAVEEIDLGALSASEVGALAAASGITLSPWAARRLHAHTAGNPRHVLALARELPAERWEDARRPLPAPRALAGAVGRTLAELSSRARELVDGAAVLGVRTSLAAVAALVGESGLLNAVDEAVGRSLLAVDAAVGDVAFAHPLIRAAAYEQMLPGRRARLHVAAALADTDTARSLRHRVAAAVMPDAGLAGELDGVARSRATTGSWERAAALWLDASRLSPDPAASQRQLLAGLDALLRAGHAAPVRARRAELETLAGAGSVLARLALLDGDAAQAGRLLGEDADDELRAALALAQLHGAEAVRWARGGGPRLAPQLAAGLVLSGDDAGARAVLDAALADAGDLSRATARRALTARGWARLVSDDVDGAQDDLEAAAAAARVAEDDAGAAGALAWLGAAQHAGGRWARAEATLEEALAVVARGEHPAAAARTRHTLALLALERGDAERAQALTTVAGGFERDRVLATELAARLQAERGDWDQVRATLEPFTRLPAAHAVHDPGIVRWADLYASALLAAERGDEAGRFLAEHERRAAHRGRHAALAALARVRAAHAAASGRKDDARAAYERALAHAAVARRPYELALSRLAYGQFLRRNAQRRDAAAQLALARDTFTALGAQRALDRTRRELSASGLAPVKRGARDLAQLTPRERSVAELAAAGLANREIAQELAVSQKTVAVHLTRIYAKLEIASRDELKPDQLM